MSFDISSRLRPDLAGVVPKDLFPGPADLRDSSSELSTTPAHAILKHTGRVLSLNFLENMSSDFKLYHKHERFVDVALYTVCASACMLIRSATAGSLSICYFHSLPFSQLFV